MSENVIDLVFYPAGYDDTTRGIEAAYEPKRKGQALSNKVRYIQVQDAEGMVRHAISTAAVHRARIKNLVFAGHGSDEHFNIGVEQITLDSVTNPNRNKARVLQMLTPYFSRGANVFVLGCHAGRARRLLSTLSTLWGVAVIGWTGPVVWGELIWNVGYEIDYGGRPVICYRYQCHQM
jgi:hypothetical protein